MERQPISHVRKADAGIVEMSTETLATLLADPERASSMPRAEFPEIIAQLERVKAALWVSLGAPAAPSSSGGNSDDGDDDDELLTRELAETRARKPPSEQ